MKKVWDHLRRLFMAWQQYRYLNFEGVMGGPDDEPAWLTLKFELKWTEKLSTELERLSSKVETHSQSAFEHTTTVRPEVFISYDCEDKSRVQFYTVLIASNNVIFFTLAAHFLCVIFAN